MNGSATLYLEMAVERLEELSANLSRGKYEIIDLQFNQFKIIEQRDNDTSSNSRRGEVCPERR